MVVIVCGVFGQSLFIGGFKGQFRGVTEINVIVIGRKGALATVHKIAVHYERLHGVGHFILREVRLEVFNELFDAYVVFPAAHEAKGGKDGRALLVKA